LLSRRFGRHNEWTNAVPIIPAFLAAPPAQMVRGRLRVAQGWRWRLVWTLPFALLVVLITAPTAQKECRTEDDFLLLETGGFLLTEDGQHRIKIGEHWQCDVTFAGHRLPTWLAQFLKD
jgi:hypothetical protein